MSARDVRINPVSTEAERIQDFKIKFLGKSHSWIGTCLKRLNDITHEAPNMWKLKGRREFNDHQKVYLVRFIPNDAKYSCTCFETRYGHVRRKEVCTHIGSIILWRMVNKGIEIKEADGSRTVRVKPILLYGRSKTLERARAMAEPPILVVTNVQVQMADPDVVIHMVPDLYQFNIGEIKQILASKRIRTMIHYFNPSGAIDIMDVLKRQLSELYGLASASSVELIYATTISNRIREGRWREGPTNAEAYHNLVSEIRYAGDRDVIWRGERALPKGENSFDT